MSAVAEQSAGRRPGWLALQAQTVRAFSLPVSVLPVPVAVAAVLPVREWHWAVLAASMAGVGLLHCAGNLLNDYFDYRGGVDHKTEGDENRPGRVLVKGLVSPRAVLAEALGCLAAAGAVTAYLMAAVSVQLGWFALIAAAAGYIYTGPPFKLKNRALGEGLIFVTFGPCLALGAAFAQTGRLEWPALWVSLPIGLATTAVLVGNNVRDRDEDRQAGIVTLSGVIGHGWLRAVYIGLVLASVASVAGLAAGGLLPRVLVLAPVLLPVIWKALRSAWRDERLSDIDAQTARFETVLLVAMLAALVWR
jgi:1,4-dihydroxy-2-naphthoate octaprenyltransferase